MEARCGRAGRRNVGRKKCAHMKERSSTTVSNLFLFMEASGNFTLPIYTPPFYQRVRERRDEVNALSLRRVDLVVGDKVRTYLWSWLWWDVVKYQTVKMRPTSMWTSEINYKKKVHISNKNGVTLPNKISSKMQTLLHQNLQDTNNITDAKYPEVSKHSVLSQAGDPIEEGRNKGTFSGARTRHVTTSVHRMSSRWGLNRPGTQQDQPSPWTKGLKHSYSWISGCKWASYSSRRRRISNQTEGRL